MIKDREHGVEVEAWDDFAHVTTLENGIGRSVELDAEEMKYVADMLYATAEKMDGGET